MENIGIGDREARIYSKIVAQRNFSFGHGIGIALVKFPSYFYTGRSGDVTAEQPKAAGASLILKLTKYLILDAFRIAGNLP